MNLHQAIDQLASPKLKQEIEHWMEVELEEEDGSYREHTEAEAFVEAVAEGSFKCENKILAAVGALQPITDEQYQNASVMGGSKASTYPLVDGVRHELGMTYDQLIKRYSEE